MGSLHWRTDTGKLADLAAQKQTADLPTAVKNKKVNVIIAFLFLALWIGSSLLS